MVKNVINCYNNSNLIMGWTIKWERMQERRLQVEEASQRPKEALHVGSFPLRVQQNKVTCEATTAPTEPSKTHLQASTIPMTSCTSKLLTALPRFSGWHLILCDHQPGYFLGFQKLLLVHMQEQQAQRCNHLTTHNHPTVLCWIVCL